MMAVRGGPFFVLADNAPKVTIFTGILYLIVTYINVVTHGALSSFQPVVTNIMIWGALFCIPLIVFDITFTGVSEKEADIIMSGFINYFALLTEYCRTNWEQVKPILYYTMYAYLGLFVVALVYITVGYVAWRTRRSKV